MGVNTLAESIILQSMEDLSDSHHKTESLEFFAGEGFRICSRMAGLKPDDEVRILELVDKISKIPHVPDRRTAVRARARSRRALQHVFG